MVKSSSRRRQKRQQTPLKELATAASAVHGVANNGRPSERKEESALLEEHQQRDEPGFANTSPSAQAEASLLVRPDEYQQPVNREARRSTRRATRLISSAFQHRQRPESSASKAPEVASDHQGEPSIASPKYTSSRHTTVFSVRTNHQRPRATSLCAAISSSRFASSAALLGSLRVATTETLLPLLDSQAQVALQLASSSGSKALQITVERSDELPFGVYSRPVVRVYVVDRCTGRSLQPSLTTSLGRFTDDGDNAFQWREALKLSVDVRDSLSPRTVLLFEILEEKNLRKRRSLDGAKFEELKSSQDERLDDGALDQDAPPTLPVKVRRIVWGFFHGITDHGGLTLPRLLSATQKPPPSAAATRTSPSQFEQVRLQLFQYQIISWMDQYQARAQWGWRKNHPTVPAVFLQYQKRSRQAAPTTLYLRLGVAQADSTATNSVLSKDSSMTANTSGSSAEHNQDSASPASPTSAGDTTAVSAVADKPIPETAPEQESQASPSPNKDQAKPREPDWMAKCKRDHLEPCLVPQRVLHSLPSGKQGCSSLAFSPCGRMLAAGVKTGLGEFHLNIYGVNCGARLCIGQGHHSIIYSVEWSSSSRSSGKATFFVVSASSDGTARLWQLELDDNEQDLSIARPQLSRLCEWHHVPSPCYVYCAIFHPLDRNVVVSGASDSHVRFQTRLPGAGDSVSAPSVKLQVSNVAVHSIRIDGPSQRLFCGDAAGTITVFSCPKDPLDARGYTRVKSIVTEQTSITSLQLHPRKGHLLVHAQPNALLQYELRSYLLLNRSYAGVSCEATLGKSVFSADGKWTVSGSEDGAPRLYASLDGQEVVTSVWGAPFFHGAPVSDVAWSPTAHMLALSSFGRNSPIVVLCTTRDAADVASPEAAHWNEATRPSSATNSNNDDPFFGGSADLAAFPPLERPLDDHARRVQQILERRRRRLEAQDPNAVRLELQALSLLFFATGGRLLQHQPPERSAWVNQRGWAELLELAAPSNSNAVEIPAPVLRRTLEVAFPNVFGVQFDKNSVVSIDLSRNGLTGALPKEIASLRSLRSLKLRDNPGLRGMLSADFVAHLPPQLRYCYLDGTKLERVLPYTSAHALEITRVHGSGAAVTVSFSTGRRPHSQGPHTVTTTHWIVNVTEAELFMMHTALVARREHQEQQQQAPDKIARTASNATGPERVAAAIKLQRIYRARMERTKFRRFLRSLFESHVDPSSGYRYFVDTRTGEASWQRPTFMSTPRVGAGESARSDQSSSESTASGDEWQPYDDGHNNTYYWNRTTGESTWEPPHLRSRLQIELIARYGSDKMDAERFELFFDEIDADHTGEVDRDAFARLCGDLGMLMSAGQIDRAFRDLDSSGDGQLSRQEIFAWLTRHF